MPNDLPDYTSQIARPSIAAVGSPFSLVSGSNQFTVALQTDTHVLGIVVTGAPAPTSLTVTGATTGVLYWTCDPQLSAIGSVIYVPVQPDIDASVTVTIVASTIGKAYVSLIADLSATVALSTTPGPWQAANQPPALIDTGSLAANAAFVILAAVTGRTYFLHGMWLTPLATTCNWHLQRTDGTDLGSYSLNQSGTPSNVITPPLPDVDLHGAPLANGQGLQLKNTSSGAVRWLGHVVYSIQ